MARDSGRISLCIFGISKPPYHLCSNGECQVRKKQRVSENISNDLMLMFVFLQVNEGQPFLETVPCPLMSRFCSTTIVSVKELMNKVLISSPLQKNKLRQRTMSYFPPCLRSGLLLHSPPQPQDLVSTISPWKFQ